MKLLHVIPSVSEKHGGPTYALQAFARATQMCGGELIVATTDDDGGRRRVDAPLGVQIERRGLQYVFFRRDAVPYKISLGLGRWLNTNVRRFDVIHIHALFSFSSYAAARAARKQRVPYIVRPLGVLNRWGMENRRPLIKKLWLPMVEMPILRHASAIHYTSEAERREASDLRPEIAKLSSFVAPIPVEFPPPVAANEFLAKYPVACGKKIILFLSRLDPKKGLELLFEAFAAVAYAQPDALLVLAGDGQSEYVDSLRALAERLSVQSRMLWCGHLGPELKAAAFAAATLFALSSYSENFGIAAAEAMAAGVPTVITDRVGLCEFTADRGAALVVKPEANALARGIERVLADSHQATTLSENGRRLVEEVFSPSVVGAQLNQIYERIVAKPSFS